MIIWPGCWSRTIHLRGQGIDQRRVAHLMVPKKWNTERKWCDPNIPPPQEPAPTTYLFSCYLPKIIPFPISCIHWPSSIWGSLLSKLLQRWKYSKGVMGKQVFTEWVWEWYLEERWYFRDDSEPPLIRKIGVKRIAEQSLRNNWTEGGVTFIIGGVKRMWRILKGRLWSPEVPVSRNPHQKSCDRTVSVRAGVCGNDGERQRAGVLDQQSESYLFLSPHKEKYH